MQQSVDVPGNLWSTAASARLRLLRQSNEACASPGGIGVAGKAGQAAVNI